MYVKMRGRGGWRGVSWVIKNEGENTLDHIQGNKGMTTKDKREFLEHVASFLYADVSICNFL